MAKLITKDNLIADKSHLMSSLNVLAPCEEDLTVPLLDWQTSKGAIVTLNVKT